MTVQADSFPGCPLRSFFLSLRFSLRRAEAELQTLPIPNLYMYDHPTFLEEALNQSRDWGDTHAKVLIKDSDFSVVSSFNWLSFKGDPSRTFRDEQDLKVQDANFIERSLTNCFPDLP
jgi:hypothetical protein